ncbi:MAG: zinc ABC transporter substrate-binding protein [Phycisphaerae bacterium]
MNRSVETGGTAAGWPIVALAAALTIGAAAGCDSSSNTVPPPTDRAPGRLTIFVTIPPQAFFVERIGREHVDIHILVKPGRSPHAFEPTPRQLTELGRADLYFQVGVPFERVLEQRIRGNYPDLNIVDTSACIAHQPIDAPETDNSNDAHDSPHAHAPGEMDPHTWLDPTLAAVHARNIADALVRIDAANAAEYRANLAALTAELDDLDRRIAAVLAPREGGAFFVFHPAYGYFARRYGLTQVAVEHGGRRPAAKQLAALIDRAKQAGVKAIFVDPQFASRDANAIAEAIGAAVIPLDPLARDYLANLAAAADKLAADGGVTPSRTNDASALR